MQIKNLIINQKYGNYVKKKHIIEIVVNMKNIELIIMIFLFGNYGNDEHHETNKQKIIYIIKECGYY